MSRTSFENCRLYVIVDRSVLKGQDPVAVAEGAIRGGAGCIQWRDKTGSDRRFLEEARRLRQATRAGGVLFVVNDRVEAALRSEADGVHLGHEDLPVPEARKLMGDAMLIGRSTHSLEEALQAEGEGADYIGVGPLFSTPTKPEYPAVGTELLRRIRERIRIPWFAIGGIDLERMPLVLSAGASRIAVVRAVAAASDPEAAARAFKERLR